MCLGALREESSPKVARSALAVCAECNDSPLEKCHQWWLCAYSPLCAYHALPCSTSHSGLHQVQHNIVGEGLCVDQIYLQKPFFWHRFWYRRIVCWLAK